MSQELFEATFRDLDKPWEHYERYSKDNKSYIRKIPIKNETYIEDPNGNFTYLMDNRIKLRQVDDSKNITCKKYGNCDAGHVWIREKYWTYEEQKYNMKPRIFFLDIETTAHAPVDNINCRERIVTIQVYVNDLNTNIVISNEPFEQEPTENGNYKFNGREYPFKLKYIQVKDEASILEAYFKLVESLKPVIVYAWNGEKFDFPYLFKRAERNGLETKFSPFGKSILDYKEHGANSYYSLESSGVFYMDYIVVYRKFIEAPRASYSLDFICSLELNEHKVNHDCFKTFDGFRTGEGYTRPDKEPSKDSTLEYLLYHAKDENEVKQISKNWFIHYSIVDTFLLYKLDQKLKLNDILMSLVSMMGCNIKEGLGTTNPWTCFIRNYCHSKGQILPNRDDVVYPDVSIKGGFVREPKAGKYEWVFSGDINSMYPNNISAYNISPETFIPYHELPEEVKYIVDEIGLDEDEDKHLKLYNNGQYEKLTKVCQKYDIVATMPGGFYTRKIRGVIPTLVTDIYNKRKVVKKEMLKYETEVEKIRKELESRSNNG